MPDIFLVRQPVFGTTGALMGYEIRVRDSADGREAFAHVFARELEIVLLVLSEQILGLLVDGARQRGLEAHHVRAAVHRVHVVHKREQAFVVAFVVTEGDFERNTLRFFLEVDGLVVQRFLVAVHVFDECRDAAGEMEFVGTNLFALVAQGDGQAFVEKGQFAETRTQRVEVVNRVREDRVVGLEKHAGALFVRRALELARCHGNTLFEGLDELAAIAPDSHFLLRGQCVYAGDAHAVQTGGNLVTVVAELATRVQFGHHQFHGTDAFSGVDVGRNAASIVRDANTVRGGDGDVDARAETGQGFVHGVVHELQASVQRSAAGFGQLGLDGRLRAGPRGLEQVGQVALRHGEQDVDGVELGGLAGRVEPEEDADGGADAEGDDDGLR